MLYYLFDYLQNSYNLPGAGLFQYISFRASLSIITSLLFTLFLVKKSSILLKHNKSEKVLEN